MILIERPKLRCILKSLWLDGVFSVQKKKKMHAKNLLLPCNYASKPINSLYNLLKVINFNLSCVLERIKILRFQRLAIYHQ